MNEPFRNYCAARLNATAVLFNPHGLKVFKGKCLVWLIKVPGRKLK
jgi:hypothetical protein